jgi:hypothetical protein
MQTRFQRRFIAVAALAAAYSWTSCCVAASVTLVERSPFVPSTFSPPQSRAPARPAVQAAKQNEFEFRGIYEVNGEYRFLISEARSRNGRWLPVGGSHESIEVQAYDPQTETVDVLINGEPRQLELAKTEANPNPQPVARQAVRPAARPSPTVARPATTTPGTSAPVRRVIRPSTNRPVANPATAQGTSAATSNNQADAPPPPAWLQELRERAAQRRAEAENQAVPE